MIPTGSLTAAGSFTNSSAAMKDVRFFIAKDNYDNDMFHLIMDYNVKHASSKHLSNHIAAIFVDGLGDLTLEHTEDQGDRIVNTFLETCKDLHKGERIEVNIRLSIAEDD